MKRGGNAPLLLSLITSVSLACTADSQVRKSYVL